VSDAVSRERGTQWRVEVLDARLVRHKPGRRCLIENELKLRASTHVERCTAMAKIRAKGFDSKTFAAMRELRGRGFDEDSSDSFRSHCRCVPFLN
jgi:hypothetical protein